VIPRARSAMDMCCLRSSLVLSPVLCASIPGMQDWASLCPGAPSAPNARQLLFFAGNDGPEGNEIDAVHRCWCPESRGGESRGRRETHYQR
jgi:hypothetical protein